MTIVTTVKRRFISFLPSAVLCLLGISCCSIASAEPSISINGYASIASDYVYRGVSLGGGRLSPHFSVAANHNSGAYISLWAARDDLGGAFNDSRRRDTEIEYQLGYQRVFNANWSASISHAWLEYENRFQPRNHDFRESRLQVNYRDNYSAFFAFARDIWTSGVDASTVALSRRSAGPYGLYFEQELGMIDFDSKVDTRSNSSLGFMRLSFAKTLSPSWSTALHYHYGKASNERFFDRERIGGRWVISGTYHFDGRF